MVPTILLRILIVLCGFIIVVTPASAADDLHIYLKYASFDPLAGEPSIPDNLRTVPAVSERASYLVQFDGPICETWKQSVTAAGAELLSYIPQYCFLAKMTPEQAESVRGLAHVRWVGVYHAAYKLDRKLMSQKGAIRAKIRTLPGSDVDQVRKEVAKLGGITSAEAADISDSGLTSTVSAASLSKIAHLKDVEWIEPRLERKLMNSVARGLVNVPTIWSNMGLYGAGEIVAVCDTGLDMGTMGATSADFAGRVLKTYALGRRTEWNDPNGHGTHVAGSILGSGALSGSIPATHSYTNSFAGAAPEAQLVFQSVIDSGGGLGGIPTDLNKLFSPPYRDGARVHSNSWGTTANGAYTTDSQNLDQFTWNNKDFVVVVAAGNEAVDSNSDGVVDLDSISAPATAKNCITVGASESYRLTDGVQTGYYAFVDSNNVHSFPADPLKSDPLSNNVFGMAAFSSRGPTDDGRIKPDVVAPGTNIISCRSHLAGSGTLWGAYNSDYNYSGGTSMSTPLTAGVSALVRQYYRTVRNHSPTSALVKATLINGATDLYPGQYGTGAFLEQPGPRPNNVEGWGRIDPAYEISPTGPHTMDFADNTSGLSTGASLSYTYSISGNPSPLRITLVWTDPPANTAAAKMLVNDLDLTVIAPDGAVLLGNGLSDHTNNVEGIDIANPMPGDYVVQVTGFNVPQGPQPFALVATAAFGPLPPKAVISSPTDGTYLSGPVTIRGTSTGAGFEHYVLEYGTAISTTSWTAIGPTQTTEMLDGVLGTWDTGRLPNGDYAIRLTTTGTGGSTTTQQTVHVLKTNIGTINATADNTPVILTGKVVSARFDGFIYVQEPNRTGGIRVSSTSLPADAQEGSLVSVSGALKTVDGERVITDAQVVVTN